MYMLSISSGHMCKVGPILLSSSTNISSIPATLLVFSAAIPFLYFSSLKVSHSATVASTVCFGLFIEHRSFVSNSF